MPVKTQRICLSNDYSKLNQSRKPVNESINTNRRTSTPIYSTIFKRRSSSLSSTATVDCTLNNHRPMREKNLEEFFIQKMPRNNSHELDPWDLEEELNHPLFDSEIRNENLKLVMLNKHVKREVNSRFKTDSCKMISYLKNAKRKFSEVKQGKVSANNLRKKRKISSCKKIYESSLTFVCASKKKFSFNVYQDEDVGFDFRFNQALKEMDEDNDVETDDEQLSLANSHNIKSLHRVVNDFKPKMVSRKIKFLHNLKK